MNQFLAGSSAPGCALLIGGRGFLARHLVDALRHAGVQRIIGTGSGEAGPDSLDTYARFAASDHSAPETLRQLLAQHRPDWIFNLVGGPRSTIASTWVHNAGFAALLLDAVQAAPVTPVVIMIGSAAEYGLPVAPSGRLTESDACHPINPYGIAKHAQTRLAQHCARQGLSVSIARIFNLIGPGISPAFFPGAILQRMQAAVRQGNFEIEVGNIETERDFVAAQDAAQALIMLARHNAPGEVFNICSGVPTRMRHLLETYRDMLDPRLSWRIDSGLVRQEDPPRVIGDPTKIQRATGWRAGRPLVESMQEAAREAQSAAK